MTDLIPASDTSKKYPWRAYTWEYAPNKRTPWTRYDRPPRAEMPDNSEPYQGMQAYEDPNTNLCVTDLVFDLDSPDTGVALIEARKLYQYLHRTIGDNFGIWYSGSKGFHFVVFYQTLGLNPITEKDWKVPLKSVLQSVARQADIKVRESKEDPSEHTLDLSLAGCPHVLRIPGYIRHNGRYKIPLTPEQLDLTIEQIEELSTVKPTKLSYYVPEFSARVQSWFLSLAKETPAKKSVSITASTEIPQEEDVDYKGTQLDWSSGGLPYCVNQLLKGIGVTEGKRNAQLLQLASSLKSAGWPQSKAEDRLLRWSADNCHTDEWGTAVDEQVKPVCKTVYEGDYVHSCGGLRNVGAPCKRTGCKFIPKPKKIEMGPEHPDFAELVKTAQGAKMLGMESIAIPMDDPLKDVTCTRRMVECLSVFNKNNIAIQNNPLFYFSENSKNWTCPGTDPRQTYTQSASETSCTHGMLKILNGQFRPYLYFVTVDGERLDMTIEDYKMSRERAEQVLQHKHVFSSNINRRTTFPQLVREAGKTKFVLQNYYNELTGMLVSMDSETAPVLPSTPGEIKQSIRAAIDTLLLPFQDFKFEAEKHAYRHLAAALTPYMATYCEDVPFFLYEASEQGSGKTALAQSLVALHGNRHNLGIWPTGDEAEVKKSLLSKLREQTPYILYDNLDGDIKSPSLSALATCKGVYSDRVLGKSETESVGVCSTMLFTGNNCKIDRDLTRRMVKIRIGKNFNKTFKFGNISDIDGPYLKNIAQYRSALWTILSGWVALGCPLGVGKYESYERWASVISGIFEAAGIDTEIMPQDIENSVGTTDEDELLQDLFAKLWCWHEYNDTTKRYVYPGRQDLTVAEIFDLCQDDPNFGDFKDSWKSGRHLGRLLTPVAGKTYIISGLTVENIRIQFVRHRTGAKRENKIISVNGIVDEIQPGAGKYVYQSQPEPQGPLRTDHNPADLETARITRFLPGLVMEIAEQTGIASGVVVERLWALAEKGICKKDASTQIWHLVGGKNVSEHRGKTMEPEDYRGASRTRPPEDTEY